VPETSPQVVYALAGTARVVHRGVETLLREGSSVVVPASAEQITFPGMQADATVVVCSLGQDAAPAPLA
jgi:mannose-6-phosphate isomerase class I